MLHFFKIFIIDGDDEQEVSTQLKDIKTQYDQLLSGKAPAEAKVGQSFDVVPQSENKSDANVMNDVNPSSDNDEKGNGEWIILLL